MLDSSLFQLPGGKSGLLTAPSVKLLIGLQLLLVVLVLAGVYLTTSHLRNAVLENTGVHAYTQVQTKQERLEHSFDLLQMHLRGLFEDNPQAVISSSSMRSNLMALERKLPFIRSISVLESDGEVILSTQRANEQIHLDLGPMLPVVSPHALNVLRFGGPWNGKDFASGRRLTPEAPGDHDDAGFFPVAIVLPQAVQWTMVVAINSDYFIDVVSESSAPGDLAFGVFLDGGTLLYSTSRFEGPGSRPLTAEQYEHVLQHHMGKGTWIDEHDALQLQAFRVARAYPWFVRAQVSSTSILETWQAQSRQLWLVSGIILTGMLLISGFLTQRVHRSLSLEEQRQEHARLAASVFLHSSDLVVIAGSRQKILAVNPAYEKITGYSASEVLGQTFWPALFEDDEALPDGDVEAHLESQSRWQGEITKRHKNGGLITGLLQVYAVRNERDDIINYIGVFTDLSHLRESEDKVRKLTLAIEQSPSSIVITNPDADIEYANPQFLRSSGYSAEEILGANQRILQSGQTPENTYKELWDRISNGKVWHGEFINRRKDGSIYYERSSISPVLDDKGRLTGYLGVKHDVTAEKEAEVELRLAASVIANTAEGVFICDVDDVIIDVNPAFTRLTGYGYDDVVGQHADMLGADGRNDAALETMRATLETDGMWEGEFWIRHKSGSTLVTFNSVSILRGDDGVITHRVNFFSDITQAKQDQETLLKQAHFDPLTGLPNRVLLQHRMEQALSHAQRTGDSFAVFFMDLDGFKSINDSYGHKVGDDLLVIISQRLKSVLSRRDTVARLGGDEFVILLTPIDGIEDCKIVAARVLQAVAEPVRLGAHLAAVSASIGITLYPLDSGDGAQLLRHADHAMYQAKQNGRNTYVVWDKIVDDD